MKSDIHPNYRPVVFMDASAEFSILTQSTVETQETIDWEDGNTYPLYKVDISSASHPFYTGTMKIIDSAGRVERFEKRYGRRRKSAAEVASKEVASKEVEEAKIEAPAESPVVDESPAAAEQPSVEESPVVDEAPAVEQDGTK